MYLDIQPPTFLYLGAQDEHLHNPPIPHSPPPSSKKKPSSLNPPWPTGTRTLLPFPVSKNPNTNLSLYSASPIIGLIFIVLISILAYFFSPKGENQTYVFSLSLFPPLQPNPTICLLHLIPRIESNSYTPNRVHPHIYFEKAKKRKGGYDDDDFEGEANDGE